MIALAFMLGFIAGGFAAGSIWRWLVSYERPLLKRRFYLRGQADQLEGVFDPPPKVERIPRAALVLLTHHTERFR